MVFQLESEGKKRVGVLDFLKEKLRKIQKEIVKEISKSANTPPLTGVYPKERLVYEVTETDQEIVTFNLDPETKK